MSRPISLTDEQMGAVFAAAQPLAPEKRSPFLAAVAVALQGVPNGDGSVHRIVRETQRQFFDPPDLGHSAPRSRRKVWQL